MTVIGSRNTYLMFLLLCFINAVQFCGLFAGVAYCGNKEIIEKNIVELDNLNKEVVSKISNLPLNGTVNLNANVSGTNDNKIIEILESNVSQVPLEKTTDSSVVNDPTVQKTYPSDHEGKILYQRENILLP